MILQHVLSVICSRQSEVMSESNRTESIVTKPAKSYRTFFWPGIHRSLAAFIATAPARPQPITDYDRQVVAVVAKRE